MKKQRQTWATSAHRDVETRKEENLKVCHAHQKSEGKKQGDDIDTVTWSVERESLEKIQFLCKFLMDFSSMQSSFFMRLRKFLWRNHLRWLPDTTQAVFFIHSAAVIYPVMAQA